MISLLLITQGILERGFIFSIVVASVYIASRIIKFDNLSIEGAFGLGASTTALCISYNINPWIALIASACVGGISGMATGLLHTKLRLNAIISGIVVTTGAFSIILKIGGANMSLHGKQTIFTIVPTFLAGTYQTLFLLCIISVALIMLLRWLLTTEVGFLLRAVGDTPQIVTNIGKRVDGYILFGLTISNMLAAVAGALFVQYAGYFSIWSSVGVLIMGLAGMILAQLINNSLGIALIIGSILYQSILALTFELQLDPDWNKLITALLIIILIICKQDSYRK